MVYGVRKEAKLIIWCVNITIVPAPFVEKTIFPPLNYLGTQSVMIYLHVIKFSI